MVGWSFKEFNLDDRVHKDIKTTIEYIRINPECIDDIHGYIVRTIMAIIKSAYDAENSQNITEGEVARKYKEELEFIIDSATYLLDNNPLLNNERKDKAIKKRNNAQKILNAFNQIDWEEE